MVDGPKNRPFIKYDRGCDELLAAHNGTLPTGVYCDGTGSDRSAFFTVFGFYIAVLLAIAFSSYQSEKKAKDKYLFHFFGGKSYSPLVLFGSLFSTIFSAYTVVGVPKEAALAGFFATRWLTSGVLIGLAGLIITPRGFRASADRNYLSPNDFIGDRYNNRILSLSCSLFSAASVFIYIITQFYTMKNMIDFLSGGSYDAETAVWLIGLSIYVAEALGGFDATTRTDAFQTIIMIVSFVVVAGMLGQIYGQAAGAADSTEVLCENRVVLDCSQAPLGPYEDTQFKCADSCYNAGNNVAYESGCLANTNSWLTLHPATEWSEFFKPLRAYGGKLDPWNVDPANNVTQLNGGPAFWESDKDAAVRLDANGCDFRKIDSSNSYNHMGVKMLSWNILTMAYILNPHWQQRTMSANSDVTVKGANFILAWITLLTTLPGVFIGITAGANLAAVNPYVSEPFAWVLSDLMDRGGFSEFVGVVAGVAAMAAMMSTIDSAIISVTNLLTREWLMNWLMYDPERKVDHAVGTSGERGVASGESNLKANSMMIICKAMSLVIVVVCIVIALYEDELDDPDVYGNMFAWSSALLWQVLPATLFGMYTDSVSGFACLLGQVTGMVTLIAMFVYKDEQEFFGSQFSYEKDSVDIVEEPRPTSNGALYVDGTDFTPKWSDTKTFYLEYYLWAGLANLAVVTTFTVLGALGLKLPDTLPGLLEMDCVKSYHSDVLGGNKPLTASALNERMNSNGGQEPIRNPIGLALMIICFVLANLCLPFYGDSYDDCDYFSFTWWRLNKQSDGGSFYPLPNPVETEKGIEGGFFFTDLTRGCGGLWAFGIEPAFASIQSALSVVGFCGKVGEYLVAAAAEAAGVSGSGSSAAAALKEQLDASANTLVTGYESGRFSAEGAYSPAALTNVNDVTGAQGNGKYCDGYDMINGIPKWGVVIIACYTVCIFCNAFAYLTWKTIDSKSQKTSWTASNNNNEQVAVPEAPKSVTAV